MTNTTKVSTKRKPFVVSATNTRIPLEKWNRGELEDQFHALYNRNLELAQKNVNLEKTVKNLNGQLKRFVGRVSTKNEDWELERLDLERKNNLLSQKLKSLKHQLLVYTRPTAQSASINYLTSRNTTTWRSKSALGHSTRPHHEQIPTNQGGNEAEIVYPKRPSTSTGFASNSKLLQDISDKTTLIKLNRELRDFKEQSEVLRFESDQRKLKLDKLQTAYDNLEEELANTRQILKDYEKSTKSLRADAMRSNESSHTSVQIAEKEVKLLRDEVKLLRSNNEKLEASVFEKDTATKSNLNELGRLKTYIQELESSVSTLESQKRTLEQKMASTESDRAKVASKYKKLRNNLQNLEITQQDTSVVENVEPIKEPKMPKEKKKIERKGSGILDRLFDDVVGIVDSHLTLTSNSTEQDPELSSTNIRWQQTYEQMYSELEKVRNMLITEYDMNKELVEEKAQLNREIERQNERYESEINNLKAQIQKYHKQIEVLENQLRSIAGGSKFEDGALKDFIMEHTSDSDITLRFSHLLITDSGLKLTNTATPTVFLLIEFFDFEFQITPLIQGPDAKFQYSSVYEVIVSDLFVHYLEMDTINVEVYEVRGATHELWGSGKISLKSLLVSKTPTKINGKLEVKGINSDTVISLLDYTIEVPFQLMKALQAQKRRKAASSYLPIDEDNLADYNTLIIQIHRCANLDQLITSPSSIYAAYELYDLPVHSTKILSSNFNPEFNDIRQWTLPIGKALHSYLKGSDLQILLINQNNGDATKSPLTTLSIPLFPLARNKKIMRTFSLSKMDGTLTDATMDVSIYWKHAYTFNDDNLEVKEKVRNESNTSKSSIQMAAKPPLPKLPILQLREQESSASISEESETPRAAEKSSESSSEDGESVIVVGSPDLEKIEPLHQKRPEPKPRNMTVDSTEQPKYDPDIEDVPLSIVPPAMFNDVGEEKLSIQTPSPTSYHSSDESTSTYTQERPSDELNRPQILEITDDMLLDAEEDSKSEQHSTIELPQPKRRSLPPIDSHQIVGKSRVEFTEPLHSSIPPSETSEMSENSTELEESAKRPQRPPRTHPRLDSPAAPSVLRTKLPITAIDSESTDALPDAIVKLRILQIQLLDHSSLLATEYDGAICFVEWGFLDFERELCATTKSLELPRDNQQTMDFMTENVYELNWRRIALLRQWMSLGIKLKFVLVLDLGKAKSSGDNMDDVAEAMFDLQEVIDSTHHVISLYDSIDMEPVANLEFEIEYSDQLWTYFEELAAKENSAHKE